MRIALIGQKGIPAKFGGVEKHVEDLAICLVKFGHEVIVYTRPNYTDKGLKNYKGIKLISLPTLPTKHLDAIFHTFLACLDVWRRRVNIIHFHSIGPSSLIWLAKILNPWTPIVATFHTRCYFHKKWGSLARAYLKFGELVACMLADLTITVSKELEKYAKSQYGGNIAYIPNGVLTPENPSADGIKKWGLEKNNYILAVSRLIGHKGIHYLIKAYNEIKTDKKLVIAGDGAYTDDYVSKLKAMAEGNRNIIFTGNQTGKVLQELFSNAYIFVQPSESEGLSIALLEAMSYGKACIVSDIPENLEALAGNGISFTNKNYKDLAEKIKYLLDNESVAIQYGLLNTERVAQEYDWNAITEKIVCHYNYLLKEKNSLILWPIRAVKRVYRSLKTI